jgi:ribosomal protein L11 methyltransferase
MLLESSRENSKLDFLEFTVRVPDELVDSIVEVFNTYNREHGGGVVKQEGFDEAGLRIEETSLVATYLPVDGTEHNVVEKLEWALRCLRRFYDFPSAEAKLVREKDWATAWRRHYHPIRLGKRILIHAAWMDVDPSPGEVEIVLDPGLAFGTGLHPTTKLALELLEEHLHKGSVVWDIGTGSGILAIAAAKLGAAQVFATDVYETAVRVAKENIERNRVNSQVEVQKGSVPQGAVAPDLMVVNILAEVILRLLEQEDMAGYLKPEGKLILSGIIDQSLDVLVPRLGEFGLKILEQRVNGNWHALLVEKHKEDRRK